MRSLAAALALLASALALAGPALAQGEAGYADQLVAYANEVVEQQPAVRETRRVAGELVEHVEERTDPAWLGPWAEAATAPAGALAPFAQQAVDTTSRAAGTAAGAALALAGDATRPADGAVALAAQIATTMVVAANEALRQQLEAGPSPGVGAQVVGGIIWFKEGTELVVLGTVRGEPVCAAPSREVTVAWAATRSIATATARSGEAVLGQSLPSEGSLALEAGDGLEAAVRAAAHC